MRTIAHKSQSVTQQHNNLCLGTYIKSGQSRQPQIYLTSQTTKKGEWLIGKFLIQPTDKVFVSSSKKHYSVSATGINLIKIFRFPFLHKSRLKSDYTIYEFVTVHGGP